MREDKMKSLPQCDLDILCATASAYLMCRRQELAAYPTLRREFKFTEDEIVEAKLFLRRCGLSREELSSGIVVGVNSTPF